MVAYLHEKNIENLVEILQVNHGTSLNIESHEIKNLLPDTVKFSNRNKIELPPPEEKPSSNVRVLELEAEALVLEMELLAA